MLVRFVDGAREVKTEGMPSGLQGEDEAEVQRAYRREEQEQRFAAGPRYRVLRWRLMGGDVGSGWPSGEGQAGRRVKGCGLRLWG